MEDFRVAHFSPGRLRIRLSQVSSDPEFGHQLEQVLSGVHGIHSVQTRPLTGSVLVLYDPDGLDVQSLLAMGKLLNLVPQDLELPANSVQGAGSEWSEALAAGVGRVGETLGNVLEQGGAAAGRVLDPRVAIPAVATGVLLRRLGLGAAMTVSPALAAAWVIVSMALGPRPR